MAKPAQGKWLQDDYVKFIRFAQIKMDVVDDGIVGVITNHSWLDNPTFKGMRRSLMASFEQIFVLDLHGSAKKKNDVPDGVDDQNVFDIEQGVAVSLFVKRAGAQRGIWHSDLWGKRIEKYRTVADATRNSISWSRLEPREPVWLFKPHDADAAAVYRTLWSLRDIFAPMGDPAPGFVTTQDAFAISFSPEEARHKVQELLGTTSEHEARRRFRLCTQSQWSYERAKAEIPEVDLISATRPVAYRLFDNRWTIWNRNVAVHRRERVMQHMQGGNIAIDVCRVVSGAWKHVFAIDLPPDDSLVSNKTKERGFVFPILISGLENLAANFRGFIDSRYEHHYTPQEILVDRIRRMEPPFQRGPLGFLPFGPDSSV